MLRNPQAVNIKPNSFGPSNPKKISNYIYETQRTLGKGNFSTVHQGVNIITSIHHLRCRLTYRSQSYPIAISQLQETSRST